MSAPSKGRRIEAGDWVRVAGPRPSLRGVAKVVLGDYDPQDGGMRAALLEAEGQESWFAVGDLVRVEADDEALLCELAHTRGLLDPERAGPLEDQLRRYREGRLQLIRSPGLLDRLWNLSSRADPEHGSARVSAFLDAAGVLLAESARAREQPAVAEDGELEPEPEELDERARRRRRREQRRRERHEALLAKYPPEVVELARRARDADLAERERVLSDDDALARYDVLTEEKVMPAILAALDLDALVNIVRAIGLFVPLEALRTTDHLLRELEKLEPPIEEVVGALSDEDLLVACSAVGIEVVDQDLDVLRLRLIGHADPNVAVLWWLIT